MAQRFEAGILVGNKTGRRNAAAGRDSTLSWAGNDGWHGGKSHSAQHHYPEAGARAGPHLQDGQTAMSIHVMQGEREDTGCRTAVRWRAALRGVTAAAGEAGRTIRA